MITEHSNTVYNCANCGYAVYFSSVDRRWYHYGSRPSCTAGFICTDVAPAEVRLPVPARVTA